MRLKNKKTGERGIINHFDNQSIVIYPIDENWNAKGDKKYIYTSLAELNAEWEDVPEEPKKYWYIAHNGEVGYFEYDDDWQYMDFNWQDKLKQIGNYFETKEEAEKAVEKLKAWKRLKDKGFVWQGWEEGAMDNGVCVIGCQIPEDSWETDIVEYLDLLFGGEE